MSGVHLSERSDKLIAFLRHRHVQRIQNFMVSVCQNQRFWATVAVDHEPTCGSYSRSQTCTCNAPILMVTSSATLELGPDNLVRITRNKIPLIEIED